VKSTGGGGGSCDETWGVIGTEGVERASWFGMAGSLCVRRRFANASVKAKLVGIYTHWFIMVLYSSATRTIMVHHYCILLVTMGHPYLKLLRIQVS
jgi:hypothetical protein